MKTYIHDAIKHELISADPYIGIKIVKGESEIGRFLSEKEFQALKAAELPTESLKKSKRLVCNTMPYRIVLFRFNEL